MRSLPLHVPSAAGEDTPSKFFSFHSSLDFQIQHQLYTSMRSQDSFSFSNFHLFWTLLSKVLPLFQNFTSLGFWYSSSHISGDDFYNHVLGFKALLMKSYQVFTPFSISTSHVESAVDSCWNFKRQSTTSFCYLISTYLFLMILAIILVCRLAILCFLCAFQLALLARLDVNYCLVYCHSNSSCASSPYCRFDCFLSMICFCEIRKVMRQL